MSSSNERLASQPLTGVAVVVLGLVVGLVLVGAGFDEPTRSPSPPERAATTGDDETENPASTTSSTTTTTLVVREAAEVKVLVANGAETEGIATQLSNQLATENGYATGSPVTTDPIAATSLFYADGYEGDADAIAAVIGFADSPIEPIPDPPPVDDTQEAHVVIVLGPDYLIG